MVNIKLTTLERDALKEVENIGAGNTATAMSQLIGKKVDITVPKIEIVALNKIHKKVTSHQRMVVALYTPVSGDLQGNVISVLFSKPEALKVADLLQKRKGGKSTVLTDLDQDALKEFGDILAGSFLTALSCFLNLKLERSYQKLVYTFGESIIDLVLLDIKRTMKHALLIHTQFKVPAIKVEGEFTMMIAMKSLSPLLAALKRKIKH